MANSLDMFPDSFIEDLIKDEQKKKERSTSRTELSSSREEVRYKAERIRKT
jgi:hypothetical protein